MEVIPRVESPASQSMKFFLSPRYTDLLEEWPSLLPHPLLSHAYPGGRVGALNDIHVYVLAFRVLLCPNRSLSASSGRAGDTRLDSSQLHRRFTIQFHLQSVPELCNPQLDVSIIDLLQFAPAESEFRRNLALESVLHRKMNASM